MKALRIDSFGPDRIALAEVDRPVPAEGQALLRVRAASLNFRDVLVARGDYNRQYPLPLTLGSDAACVVESFGPGTDPGRFRIGDRVCPALAQSWFDGPPLRDAVRYTLAVHSQGCSRSTCCRASTRWCRFRARSATSRLHACRARG